MPRRLRAVVACVAMLASWLGPAPEAAAAVDSPTVAGPITGGIRGYPLWDSWYDLTGVGYEEAEYFVSGTARQASGATAPYTTRVIVTRPIDENRFNGSVLLDWTNVTAQFENAVDSVEAHEFLIREGWAFVHVSAQSAGVCCTPLTPKVWDPVRYAPLDHPGDNYAFDIFSQVAQSIDAPQAIDPLGGLPSPRWLIAAGQSQSASRLDSYVRNWQASAGIIDGFLIHSLGSKTFTAPPPAPVLHLLSDAEASVSDPTHEGENYRLWEIAGSAHSDFWIGYHQEVGQGPRFAGAPKQPASADEEMHEIAGNYGEQPHPMHAACIFAGAAFPMRYSVSAALSHLDRWVRTGDLPPAGDRYAFNGGSLARDEHGNALGGIRLAPVEVPVARYVSTSCALGGITVPFTEVELRAFYPTHEDYYERVLEVTKKNVIEGFLLVEDARDFLTRACAAKIRWQELSGTPCADPFAELDVPFHVPGTVHKTKPNKNGFPSAFLSTSSFDATTIDAASVCVFEHGSDPEPSPPCGLMRATRKDVDGDGLNDLEMRFDANRVEMSTGRDKTICATGETGSGQRVRGCASGIRVV